MSRSTDPGPALEASMCGVAISGRGSLSSYRCSIFSFSASCSMARRRSLSDIAGQQRLSTWPGRRSVIIQSAPMSPP